MATLPENDPRVVRARKLWRDYHAAQAAAAAERFAQAAAAAERFAQAMRRHDTAELPGAAADPDPDPVCPRCGSGDLAPIDTAPRDGIQVACNRCDHYFHPNPEADE